MVKAKTLLGSLLVLLVLGSVYSWSLFNSPLAAKYELDLNVIAFTFGIMTLFIAIGSSSSGFLKLKLGMQNVVALSAVCVGAGLLLAAFAPNLIVLYLSAGLLLGFGDGLGYMLVLTNCVKFFPKSKGLISALCIGAYGLGSLLFKSIDSYILANFNLESALLTWGVICAVVVTLGSILIYDAMQQASVVSANNSKREYDLHSAIRTLPYWLLSVMFFVDCMVGLYVIGVASNLGTVLLNMSAMEAATAVSVVAIANILGRLIMGMLSDKLPRIRLITFDQCLSLIAMVMLVVMPLTPMMFFAAIALIAFSFGGTLTIYPSIISDFFGIKNLAKNYGLLYLGFGLGSLCGYIFAYAFGSYELTFIMMGVCLVVAIVASLMVRLPAELKSGHSELVRTHKIRTPEEAAAAAAAALIQADAKISPELAAKAAATITVDSAAVTAASATAASAATADNAAAANDAATATDTATAQAATAPADAEAANSEQATAPATQEAKTETATAVAAQSENASEKDEQATAEAATADKTAPTSEPSKA